MSTPDELLSGNVKDFYSTHLSQFGTTAQGVGWKNEEAQQIRFEQLAKVLPKNEPFTVNDLGCGIGGLADFLEKKFQSFTYYGYDILDEMISLAKANHHASNIEFHKVEKAADMKHADFTIGCGIFNMRDTISDKQWLEYIVESIHEMHRKSTKGFAFNALTIYSDKEFMKPELYYSDPLFLFDYCKKNFSKNVALLHDYYQYDFTILVRTV